MLLKGQVLSTKDESPVVGIWVCAVEVEPLLFHKELPTTSVTASNNKGNFVLKVPDNIPLVVLIVSLDSASPPKVVSYKNLVNSTLYGKDSKGLLIYYP